MSAVEPKSLFEQFFQATDEAWSVVALEPAASPRVDVARENRSFRLLAQDGGTAPLTDPFWIAELERVARTGAELRACVRIDAARWVELHAFLLEDGSRPLLGLRLKDLREHRAATGQLICLRRIRTVGVLFWGAGFGLEDVNDGFVLMSGFSREEAIGRTWQELTPEEFHAQSWNAVRQVLTAGEAVPYEKQYFRKDGSRWWGLFAPRRVGEQVIEFVLDVTEQRRAEAALREADRRKDEFLATLAHELRNPLAPIKNGTQIMRLKLPRDAPVQRTLAIVDRQVDHLVRLVDDLLDIARITSGKVRIERQPVALREVLARSLDSIQPRLAAKAHRLLADMPPQDMHVLGDEDRLTQVFSNLLSNAVKYTPQGGEIRVAAVADASEAVVRVGDSGIGIPPAQQAGVFDLFSQVRDHQSHAEGGLGIGLALVRNLVHLHGGRVEVESPGVGQGSVFTVRLPLLRLSVAAPAPASTQRPTEPARRILVADDNGDAADTLAALLTAAGHEVITACNGLDALEKASDFKPELAFLDVGMPVMDGIEAARRMRAREDLKDMKLVALTGWGQSADRQRTAEAGFDLHLIKPLTAAGLAAALAAGSTQPGSTVAGTRPSRSGGDAEKP